MGSITFVKENGITYMLLDGKKITGALSDGLAKPHTYNNPNAIEIDNSIITASMSSVPITPSIQAEIDKLINADWINYNGYQIPLTFILKNDTQSFIGFGQANQDFGVTLLVLIENDTITTTYNEV